MAGVCSGSPRTSLRRKAIKEKEEIEKQAESESGVGIGGEMDMPTVRLRY